MVEQVPNDFSAQSCDTAPGPGPWGLGGFKGVMGFQGELRGEIRQIIISSATRGWKEKNRMETVVKWGCEQHFTEVSMRSYTHFTLTERESLRILLEQGLSYRKIAERLGRNVSSISREMKRNGKKDGSLNAWWGTSLYLGRRKKCRRTYRLYIECFLFSVFKVI